MFLWSLTFWIKQLSKAQFLLSHVKSILEIVVSIGPFQGVKLNQVRSAEAREQSKDYREIRVQVDGKFTDAPSCSIDNK